VVRFDAIEVRDILVSVFAIALAFVIHDFKRGMAVGVLPFFFIIYLVTVGSAFVFHELAHKFVAIRYGAWASFRAWQDGLIFMLITAVFLPFVFAAPGAVYIFAPYITRRQNGLISLAGPFTNFLLAIGFTAILFAVVGVGATVSLTQSATCTIPSLLQLAAVLSLYGTMINVFLWLFNMLPFGPLDGRKVMEWSFSIWAVFFMIFLISFFGLDYVQGAVISN